MEIVLVNPNDGQVLPSLTIPVHQLFQPATVIGSRGQMELLRNNTDTTILPVRNHTSDGKVRLGLPFLSSNYLVVNLENGTFSLAPIKRNYSPDPPDIVPIGGNQSCGIDVPTPKPGLGTGRIVGTVVGSIVGVALLSLAGFWGYRRYSKKRDMPVPTAPPDPESSEMDGTTQRHQLEGKSATQFLLGNAIFHKSDHFAPVEEVHHMNDHYPPGVRQKTPTVHEMD